ncbi:hypothetical protein D9757_006557 [Collybiopsis confluens]|uniref:P/Homo B domain-containing protein n=1 Tax=Collybiopsis confluens TaxID=2823264 RepID=A0A8H5HQA7_9AGAR|nr:hypothetical protein D9757_006557 [Collybiopsis confluens]
MHFSLATFSTCLALMLSSSTARPMAVESDISASPQGANMTGIIEPVFHVHSRTPTSSQRAAINWLMKGSNIEQMDDAGVSKVKDATRQFLQFQIKLGIVTVSGVTDVFSSGRPVFTITTSGHKVVWYEFPKGGSPRWVGWLSESERGSKAVTMGALYKREGENQLVRVVAPVALDEINTAEALQMLKLSGYSSVPAKRYYDTHNYYVLEHSKTSYSLSLDKVSQLLGVEVVEQAGELVDHWLVRVAKPELAAREETDSVLDTYQRLKTGTHADLSGRGQETTLFPASVLKQRAKRTPIPLPQSSDSPSPARATAQRLGIQDPLFPDQWHLINDEFPSHMMNVTGVWEELGFTGNGVISSIVDDGLDYDNEDLKDNFDAADSYDFNDHISLPTPKLPADHHGTRCAGQIAAKKNTLCGVGIAYNSRVSGVRILSGPISDVDEAAALNYGFHNVSIYSCSWGPPDDGKSMEGPSTLIKKAVVNGINNGRGGKGSIFVFASGNGAHHGDQCNFDGYTNSIYSVTVSAIDYKGLHPYYSEPCAANMVVAYSSGSGKHIVTTDKGTTSCATSHGGTSAAAPNAVGVIALALEANPDLSWRDVQYIAVLTARQVNPNDPDWEKTKGWIRGAQGDEKKPLNDISSGIEGKPYSYKYGYGAIDGYQFVRAAQQWKSVKPQVWIRTHSVQLNNGTFNEKEEYNGGLKIPQDPAKAQAASNSRAHLGDGPEHVSDDNRFSVTSNLELTAETVANANFDPNFLEHIQIQVWIQHARRGDVEVSLTSPQGVVSVLGAMRENDEDKDGYPGWVFMTVKHWGENPIGTWKIQVSDQSNPNRTGSFLGWNMAFWGAALDALKPTPKYEVPSYEKESDQWVFPPLEDSTSTSGDSPSTTRLPTRPTDLLPGDHGSAEGENTKPAFGSGSARPSSTPTPDEGYFSDLSKLSANRKWFGGAIALVALFGLGAAVFLWKRRRSMQRSKMAYESLAVNEDVPMTGFAEQGGLMSGQRSRRGGGGDGQRSGRTRELYDAFGEMSDDDDDNDGEADEATRLNPRGGGGSGVSIGGNEVGFHSGFLDDEDEESGVSPKASRTDLKQTGYRDEP